MRGFGFDDDSAGKLKRTEDFRRDVFNAVIDLTDGIDHNLQRFQHGWRGCYEVGVCLLICPVNVAYGLSIAAFNGCGDAAFWVN